MLSPVSWASCSRICRVGLGVAANAALRVSSCLALMVVLGPRLLAPAVEPPLALSFISSPERSPSGVRVLFVGIEFPFVSQLWVLWLESEEIFNSAVSSFSGSGLGGREFKELDLFKLLLLLLFILLLFGTLVRMFSLESMSVLLSPSMLKSLSESDVWCSSATSKSPSSSISEEPEKRPTPLYYETKSMLYIHYTYYYILHNYIFL